MTLEKFRPITATYVESIAKKAISAGFTPNYVSLISLIFSMLAGVAFYYSLEVALYAFVGVIFVALNSFFDALDGSMARYMGNASKKGDFLDHVIDRYADMFIIGGIFFGGHVDWEIGVIALVGVLLTSYLGTQAQALGIGRFYGGLMGRADRLVLIMVAAVAYVIYAQPLAGYTILGWCVVILAFTSHITALQRIYSVWNKL
ncbi:MAG: archaetidylinositol phosphate synthase [Methanohalophilus sp.]|nr:archaetidylinositol phosphate synthase [Methanohalophilus sp.]MDK2892888.1 archaetidylinositol phosphate synthase [Methanohalophilus sp.]